MAYLRIQSRFPAVYDRYNRIFAELFAEELGSDPNVIVSFQKDGKEECQMLNKHRKLPAAMDALKKALSQRPNDELHIHLEGYPPDWWTPSVSAWMGRQIKSMAQDTKVMFDSLNCDAGRFRPFFLPLVEEIAPVVSKLSCDASELAYYSGCELETLDLRAPRVDKEKVLYLEPLFRIPAVHLGSRFPLRLEWFKTNSPYPAQPKAKTLVCTNPYDLKIDLVEEFYELSFKEIENALPNLELVTLHCHVTVTFLELVIERANCTVDRIKQIAKFANVKVKGEMEIWIRFRALYRKTCNGFYKLFAELNDCCLSNLCYHKTAPERQIAFQYGKHEFVYTFKLAQRPFTEQYIISESE